MITPFEAYLESDQADDDYAEWCDLDNPAPAPRTRARWEFTADCYDTAQAWIDDEGEELQLERGEVDRAEGLT